MYRLWTTALGLLIGAVLAALSIGLLTHRPESCGEPAACSDDYLYPALYFAGSFLIGFPTAALVIGREKTPAQVLVRLGLAGLAVAVVIYLLS